MKRAPFSKSGFQQRSDGAPRTPSFGRHSTEDQADFVYVYAGVPCAYRKGYVHLSVRLGLFDVLNCFLSMMAAAAQ